MAEQKRAMFAITVKGSKENELGARIIKMGSMHVGIIKRESLGNSFVFTTEKTEINMSFKNLEELINAYEKIKKEYDELNKQIMSSTDNNSMIVELKKKKIELNKLELKLQPNTIKNKIEQLQNKLKEVTKEDEKDKIEQEIYGLTVDRFFSKIRSKFIKGVSLEEPKPINKFVEAVKNISKETSTVVKENYDKVSAKVNDFVEPVNEKIDVAVKTVKYFSAKVALMKDSAVKRLAKKPKKVESTEVKIDDVNKPLNEKLETPKGEEKKEPVVTVSNNKEVDKAFDIDVAKKEKTQEISISDMNKILDEKMVAKVVENPKIESTVVADNETTKVMSNEELNKLLTDNLNKATKDEVNDDLNQRFDHYEEESEVSLLINKELTDQEKISILDKDVENAKPSDKSLEEKLAYLKKEEKDALKMDFDKNEITEAPLKELNNEPKVEAPVKENSSVEKELIETTKLFKDAVDFGTIQSKRLEQANDIIATQAKQIEMLMQMLNLNNVQNLESGIHI